MIICGCGFKNTRGFKSILQQFSLPVGPNQGEAFLDNKLNAFLFFNSTPLKVCMNSKSNLNNNNISNCVTTTNKNVKTNNSILRYSITATKNNFPPNSKILNNKISYQEMISFLPLWLMKRIQDYVANQLFDCHLWLVLTYLSHQIAVRRNYFIKSTHTMSWPS